MKLRIRYKNVDNLSVNSQCYKHIKPLNFC